jgi:AN1-type zinc finger protein 1
MASSSVPDLVEESYTAMDNEKDATLIGSHCQFAYCNQLDFLPFRCESCRGTFCLDHRTETTHQCPRAGEWAARRRRAQLATPSIGAGKTLQEVETERPCASPSCKSVIGSGLNPSVHCPTCNRSYCLKHRLKEDHNCKNLIPIGARPAGRFDFDTATQTEKARLAFGKLKAWGSAQKNAAASRVLPKAKPTSASARLVAVNALKKSAKGDEKLPPEKRVYLYVEAEAATTTAKFPKGSFFYSKDWVIGRVLDAAAKSLQVQNVNNQGMDEKDKLRVFHVEGGRLLEFNEKVGTAVVSGNTIVLLRGVGPAVPDLIEA